MEEPRTPPAPRREIKRPSGVPRYRPSLPRSNAVRGNLIPRVIKFYPPDGGDN